MTVLSEVLLEEGYHSTDELARDWALMVALARLEQYQAECEFFEKKYNLPWEQFDRLVHREKGHEDFEQEEDIEDWEFSANALKWWQAKVEELGYAAGD
ncbi:MAG: hypothetical protein HC875_37530 [Anaerolineales bacterium]|nr:hypothetical protein [Anaerolineales bacterium]